MDKQNLPGFTSEASLDNINIITRYELAFDYAVSQDREDRIYPSQQCGPDEMAVIDYYPCVQYADGTIGWCQQVTCKPAQRIPGGGSPSRWREQIAMMETP